MKKAFAACILICIAMPFTAVGEDVGGGDVTYTPKNAKQVVFSHQMHVGDKNLKCSACHFHTFEMSKGSYKMNMSKLTKGDFCGKCHNGERSFDVKETKNCIRCHK